jgi:predicted nucleotidyltransferase
MLDLTDSQLEIIKNILRKHIPDCEVRVFGSRLTNKAKNYSDLDLVAVGQTKIDRQKMIRLKEAFEESVLPFRVEILDWHKISENFKKIIEKNYLVI